jgi:hypothetical protein
MGKINLVRRFIPDFARMVKPIHNMINQDRSFSWNDDTKNSFVEVKKAINSAPVLAKPNFENILLSILMLLKKRYLLFFFKRMIKIMTNP